MFKCKYLATNQEEVTVGNAAKTVAIIVDDAVELQSMFENLFYHHFKRSRLEMQSMFENVFYHHFI
jgi:hypothetical protein